MDKYHEKRVDKIKEICDSLGCSKSLEEKALEILSKVEEKKLHLGHSSEAISLSCLYISSRLKDEFGRVTQRKLADYSKVSETAIRNNYQRIKKELEIKIPKVTRKKAIKWCDKNIPVCYCKKAKEKHKAHPILIEFSEQNSTVSLRIRKLSKVYSKGYCGELSLWRAYRPSIRKESGRYKPLEEDGEFIEEKSRTELLRRLKELTKEKKELNI